MANARYFLPDHPTLKAVYSKSELRSMLISGELSRSDMVLDDETGLGHLLGDLLAVPYPDVTNMPTRTTSSSTSSGNAIPRPQLPPNHEFRADTPLPRPESEFRPPSARRAAREHRGHDHDHDDELGLEEDEARFEEEDDEADFDGSDSPVGDEDEYADDGRVEDAVNDHDDALRLNELSSEAGRGDGIGVQEWRPGGNFVPPHRGAEEILYPEDREPEEMLYQGHPSWFAYPRSLLALVLAVTGAMVSHRMQFGLEWVMLFSSVAGLILLFVGLDRYTCTYFITTRRVEMEYGVIGRNTKEVRIRDIRAIDVQQRGWRALLGMGNVKFDSAASAGPEIYFRNVHRPHTLKELVREMQG